MLFLFLLVQRTICDLTPSNEEVSITPHEHNILQPETGKEKATHPFYSVCFYSGADENSRSHECDFGASGQIKAFFDPSNNIFFCLILLMFLHSLQVSNVPVINGILLRLTTELFLCRTYT
jgi:hypothetical protein